MRPLSSVDLKCEWDTSRMSSIGCRFENVEGRRWRWAGTGRPRGEWERLSFGENLDSLRKAREQLVTETEE